MKASSITNAPPECPTTGPSLDKIAWLIDVQRRATNLFAHEFGLALSLSELVPVLHPRAIQYLEQAPVIGLYLGIKKRWPAFQKACASGARLKDIMAIWKLPLQLRALLPENVTRLGREGVWGLACLDPRLLGQVIPTDPQGQYAWSMTMCCVVQHSGIAINDVGMAVEWFARHALEIDGGIPEFLDFMTSGDLRFNPAWSVKRAREEVAAWHDRLNAAPAFAAAVAALSGRGGLLAAQAGMSALGHAWAQAINGAGALATAFTGQGAGVTEYDCTADGLVPVAGSVTIGLDPGGHDDGVVVVQGNRGAGRAQVRGLDGVMRSVEIRNFIMGSKEPMAVNPDAVIDGIDWEDVYWNDGFEFRLLRTPREIADEGAAMAHCVAAYIPKVARKECHILGCLLKGDRIATLEVDAYGREVQFKGKRNGRPRETAWQAMRPVVAALEAIEAAKGNVPPVSRYTGEMEWEIDAAFRRAILGRSPRYVDDRPSRQLSGDRRRGEFELWITGNESTDLRHAVMSGEVWESQRHGLRGIVRDLTVTHDAGGRLIARVTLDAEDRVDYRCHVEFAGRRNGRSEQMRMLSEGLMGRRVEAVIGDGLPQLADLTWLPPTPDVAEPPPPRMRPTETAVERVQRDLDAAQSTLGAAIQRVTDRTGQQIRESALGMRDGRWPR